MQLCVSLLALSFVFILAQNPSPPIRPNPQYMGPPTAPKYCARAQQLARNTDNDYSVVSLATCNLKVAALLFRISSGPLPHFRLSFVKPGKTEVARVYNHIAYDRILEYMDTDGEKGYQPSKDIILRTHWLGEGFGPNVPGFKWSPITTSNVTLPTGDTLRRFSFNLRKALQTRFLCDIQFGVDITPREINVNGTIKTILTPNSFKITFDATNITYTNSSASGFALGAVIVTAASIRARANATIVDGARPDDQTPNQNAFGVPDADNTTLDGAVVGWQNGFTARWADGSMTSKNLIATGFTEITSSDGGVELIAGYKATRVWYSVDGQATDVHWDPTIAAGEIYAPNQGPAQGGNASSIILSVTLLIMIALSYLF